MTCSGREKSFPYRRSLIGPDFSLLLANAVTWQDHQIRPLCPGTGTVGLGLVRGHRLVRGHPPGLESQFSPLVASAWGQLAQLSGYRGL